MFAAVGQVERGPAQAESVLARSCLSRGRGQEATLVSRLHADDGAKQGKNLQSASSIDCHEGSPRQGSFCSVVHGSSLSCRHTRMSRRFRLAPMLFSRSRVSASKAATAALRDASRALSSKGRSTSTLAVRSDLSTCRDDSNVASEHLHQTARSMELRPALLWGYLHAMVSVERHHAACNAVRSDGHSPRYGK